MADSVEFTWNADEFDALLACCKKDDGVNLSLSVLPPNKDAQILEAGCGLGRVVKYLSDMGYKNTCGIELNAVAVAVINKRFPELNIIAGDILAMPYPDDYFDVIVSYGVVEHFPASMQTPLKALRNKLKPGGKAVITIPSFNYTRRLKYIVLDFLGRLKNKKSGNYIFNVDPPRGDFFEYRLTKREFETECRKAGFKVITSIPIAHIDGFYHDYSKKLIRFENWQFRVNPLIKPVERAMRLIPFLHNHMHACVLTK